LTTVIRLTDEVAIKEIQALVKKHDVSRLVIGLPYFLSGAMGKQAEKVLSFTEQVRQSTGLEIIMQDERLSSVSADQKLREAGRKRSRLKGEMDAAAASVILQSFLDEEGNGQHDRTGPAGE
jgi:putative Holliday junction resolvase